MAKGSIGKFQGSITSKPAMGNEAFPATKKSPGSASGMKKKAPMKKK